MPLGFQRLNERTHRPNECINFIKPLASSSEQDQKIAKDFLERIAAQCYPIMKKEYVSVMSLEEYPPNPEFLGRNFNAGEIVQLVLKDKAGRWLSFKFVQMVMMHELAHCKQMNHSRFFWQVRNKYAESMRELWQKKYTGEGMWGRGQNLESGVFVHDHMPDSADIPEHLCGGTYRRGRGRKRKRGQNGEEKPRLTYAERQQKRIQKKFGKHGDGYDLGEDELVRGGLEKGKSRAAKPRVANSKRGRELRANAALARFEAAKKPQDVPELEEDDGSETETESSDDEYGDSLPILETLGEIMDHGGRQYFKVDEDGEDDGDDGGKDELKDLQFLGSGVHESTFAKPSRLSAPNGEDETVIIASEGDAETIRGSDEDDATDARRKENEASGGRPKIGDNNEGTEPSGLNGPAKTSSLQPDGSETDDEQDLDKPLRSMPTARTQPRMMRDYDTSTAPTHSDNAPKDVQSEDTTNETGPNGDAPATNQYACPICSLDNPPDAVTCAVCSHVLKPKLMSNHWRCKSEQCKGSKYINIGDAGLCQVCGARKPAADGKPMGVTNADVLRWD